ncbi:MAG: M20/M25/M40 family metallo-hydrolase [Anaerolineales bacterium]|nr:M20/M25/M40 family metallo-hydrolase [Anaerolineales bacterium]
MDLKETKRWIDGQVWSSPMLNASLLALADDYGPRFCGTEKEALTQDWIEARMREMGLENVHRETFDYTAWNYTSAFARLCRESGSVRQIPIVPHVYCPPADMSMTEIVDVGQGSEAEFKACNKEIQNKLVLCEARLWPVFRKGFEGDYGPVQMAVDSGAAGFILMNPVPLAGPRAVVAPHLPGRPCPIPAVGVSYEDGAYIRRSCRRKNMSAMLHVSSSQKSSSTVNIIGDIGTIRADTKHIVVSAHYDGIHTGKGAIDNASGVACVLETARILANGRSRLKRPIRIVFIGAEELDRQGSRRYLEAHAGELENIELLLNVDKARRPFGLMVQGSNDLYGQIERMWGSIDQEFHITDVRNNGSDDEMFVRAGIPSIAYMGNLGELDRCFAHSPADTIDKLDLQDVQAAAAAICTTVSVLASMEKLSSTRLSLDELEAYLIKKTNRHFPFGV